MPVIHVVTLTFTPNTTDHWIRKLAAALDNLALQSNAIFYHHGRDLNIRDGNADYAITAVFDDQQTFRAYMTSPQHQQIIRDLVTPCLQTRSAVQFHTTSSG